MSDAEKALEWFESRIEYFAVKNPQEIAHIETIRKALQGIAKSRGLLKALQKVRTDAAIDHDHLPPSQVMGNLLGFIEDAATKAITDFNSDETGAGL